MGTLIPKLKDDVETEKKGGKSKKNWLQGAVNSAHKGFCTPMTKATCTPRRKAFAKTMKKHHGFHKKHEEGGRIQKFQISGKFNNVYGKYTYKNPNDSEQADLDLQTNYGASFIPQQERIQAMVNWNKNKGIVKNDYNIMNNVNPQQIQNLSLEELWKLRANTRNNYNNRHNNVFNESNDANSSIVTNQIRGPRMKLLPEEITMNNYYNSQRDSLNNSYDKFETITKPILLQKEKATGLSENELGIRYSAAFKKQNGGTIDFLQPLIEQFQLGGNIQYGQNGLTAQQRQTQERQKFLNTNPDFQSPYSTSERVQQAIGTGMKVAGDFATGFGQTMSGTISNFGLNLPSDALRSIGVNVPETMISPRALSTGNQNNQTLGQNIGQLASNAGTAVATDMGFSLAGKAIGAAIPTIKRIGNYALEQARPYLVGEQHIPMTGYKPTMNMTNDQWAKFQANAPKDAKGNFLKGKERIDALMERAKNKPVRIVPEGGKENLSSRTSNQTDNSQFKAQTPWVEQKYGTPSKWEQEYKEEVREATKRNEVKK